MMKIVFFGTPQFALPFLQELIKDREIEVAAVVTQPDKPSGRGGKVTPPPIKLAAQNAAITLFQPTSLKTNPSVEKLLRDIRADVFVVVAYGKMIPKRILDIPLKGVVNVHPSLLPRHRGPSPLQWAIAEGDSQSGVAIMLLDEGMDTGPLLASEHISLDADETYESLVKKVRQIGPTLLVLTLKRYMDGKIIPIPQNEAKATHTRLLEREDGHVRWSEGITNIERKHRAYSPWPGSWSVWKRNDGSVMRLKFLKLRPVDFHADVTPATVTIKDDRMYIDASDGTLEILELQPEGKSKMRSSDFIQGHPDVHGALLE